MAIDTRDKRFSFPRGRLVQIPLADGGFDNAADRRQLLGFYRGIALRDVSTPSDWTDVIFTGLLVDSIGQDRIVTLVGKFKAR